MYHKYKKQDGFTLIELMLAMVFVAFILVFISLTLVQMFRTYDKGNSMKQVNQAGRSIVEDIGQAVRSQLPANINTNAVDVGVLCIDNVMYVWNPLYTDDTSAQVPPTWTVAANQRAVIGNPTTGGMMARKVLQNPALGCPATLADALGRPTVASQDTQLLSGQTRVLRSKVTRLDTRLVKLEFTIGTYGRSEILGGAAATKYLTATRPPNGQFTCLVGNNGNYCSFAEFSTVVYLSKDQ